MLYYLCRVAMSYAVAVVCRPPSIADGRGRDGGGRSRRTECGQTNWIKFIPFVCPSQSMLHHQHRRHPLPSSNHGDRQTNWIKFIPFVCPSQSMLPTRDIKGLLISFPLMAHGHGGRIQPYHRRTTITINAQFASW